MKSIFTVLFILITSQIFSQTWNKSGADFIGDTVYFNGLSSLIVDQSNIIFAVSLEHTNFTTLEDLKFTQVYKREDDKLVEYGDAIWAEQDEDIEVNSSSLNAEGNTIIIGRTA